ncbi:TPA: hypothetical protein SOK46_003887 [Clostridioides difficile]|nr:hypothetical protein [Clostridioides difficile]HEK4616661.1 hypothetical protein [Clostridioides difficile]HEK4645833.1 hypothetical protein [Clostridioides difficile]HEK4906286.1 hypothetical protein [Clostridioides difficile]HEK4925638.1 hypothetical protein [Clostridioides difficile]
MNKKIFTPLWDDVTIPYTPMNMKEKWKIESFEYHLKKAVDEDIKLRCTRYNEQQINRNTQTGTVRIGSVSYRYTRIPVNTTMGLFGKILYKYTWE